LWTFCSPRLDLLAVVFKLLHELDVKLLAHEMPLAVVPPLAVVLQLATEHGEAYLVSFVFLLGACIAREVKEL